MAEKFPSKADAVVMVCSDESDLDESSVEREEELAKEMTALLLQYHADLKWVDIQEKALAKEKEREKYLLERLEYVKKEGRDWAEVWQMVDEEREATSYLLNFLDSNSIFDHYVQVNKMLNEKRLNEVLGSYESYRKAYEERQANYEKEPLIIALKEAREQFEWREKRMEELTAKRDNLLSSQQEMKEKFNESQQIHVSKVNALTQQIHELEEKNQKKSALNEANKSVVMQQQKRVEELRAKKADREKELEKALLLRNIRKYQNFNFSSVCSSSSAGGQSEPEIQPNTRPDYLSILQHRFNDLNVDEMVQKDDEVVNGNVLPEPGIESNQLEVPMEMEKVITEPKTKENPEKTTFAESVDNSAKTSEHLESETLKDNGKDDKISITVEKRAGMGPNHDELFIQDCVHKVSTAEKPIKNTPKPQIASEITQTDYGGKNPPPKIEIIENIVIKPASASTTSILKPILLHPIDKSELRIDSLLTTPRKKVKLTNYQLFTMPCNQSEDDLVSRSSSDRLMDRLGEFDLDEQKFLHLDSDSSMGAMETCANQNIVEKIVTNTVKVGDGDKLVKANIEKKETSKKFTFNFAADVSDRETFGADSTFGFGGVRDTSSPKGSGSETEPTKYDIF